MIFHNPVSRGILRAFVLGAVALSATAADAQEDLFKGKTVKVMIGYAPGGGYDIYARTMARHIGKYLPGEPRVIAQNVVGAGSIRVVNYLYNQAPKDGTEFGTFSRTLPVLAFAGGDNAKGIRFDPLKLTWIGTSSSYANDAYLMAVRKDTGVNSVAEMRNKGSKELNFASTGFGSTGHDIPLILRATLGLNVQVVHGYPGGNSLYLAVDRGEMDGRMVGYSSVKSAHREWLAEDSPVQILLQFARETRHPDLPNVPTAREMARPGADRDLIELMEAPYYFARPFAGPPDIPAENAKAVRDAFMKAHSDPVYVEEAKKLKIDVSPRNGEEVQKVVARIGTMPRELYDRYADILANPKSKARTVNWIKVSGKITKVGKKGRLNFDAGGKEMQTRARNSYTAVKVDGKDAKSKAIQEGMACDIWYEGNKTTAGRIECNSN